MMDPVVVDVDHVDHPEPVRFGVPPAIAPPRGLSGIFDDYDPNAILDTSVFTPNQVLLNVYDLGDNETFRTINRVSTANNNLLLGGLFHASVEVYGVEWCYGYTPENRTGVSYVPPRSHPQHTYRTTVPMGVTQLSEQEVKRLLSRMSKEWLGPQYSLIHKNCLNFANALCQELGVGRIPGWVDRASRTASLIDTTSRTASEKARETARLAREMSIEVEQQVKAVLPAPEDVEEAQRAAAEALEVARRESLVALEVAQLQAQELAEAAQQRAQVMVEETQAQLEVLSEVVKERSRELAEKAQELHVKTQEQARAFSSSLWQWGQELQRSAARALGDEPAGGPAGLGDLGLGELFDLGGLLGGAQGDGVAPLAAPPARKRASGSSPSRPREDAWSMGPSLDRLPPPRSLPVPCVTEPATASEAAPLLPMAPDLDLLGDPIGSLLPTAQKLPPVAPVVHLLDLDAPAPALTSLSAAPGPPAAGAAPSRAAQPTGGLPVVTSLDPLGLSVTAVEAAPAEEPE